MMAKIIDFFERQKKYAIERSNGILRLWYPEGVHNKNFEIITKFKSLGFKVEEWKMGKINVAKIWAAGPKYPSDDGCA